MADFRSLPEMRAFAEQAKRVPAKEAAFRSLYLNQPIDSAAPFIPRAEWMACAEKPDIEALSGARCLGGLDLSSTCDLTSFVLVFPDGSDGFDVLPYFWLPEEGLAEREDKDRAPYTLWKREGFLETTQCVG